MLTGLFCYYFQETKLPPSHVLIRSGHIILNTKHKASNAQVQHSQYNAKCIICERIVVAADRVECLNNKCSLDCHLICLSERFLEPNEYVPIIGSCPKCRQMMLWSDVIRRLIGCTDTVQDDSD